MRTHIRLRSYTDYRAFLLAAFDEAKQRNPRWSLGAWARRLGISGKSSLVKILLGSRNPGPRLTVKLIEYFEFSSADAQYFRDLVRLHKERGDPRLAVALLEKMSKEHAYDRQSTLDDDTLQLIANWYALPIRELVRTEGFEEDPAWIVGRFLFDVGEAEVREALEALSRVGLLRRDASGRLEIAEGRLQSRDDRASEAVKRHHEQVLDNAKRALRALPVERREFSSTHFAMRAANVPRAKELLREFRERFSRLLEERPADSVFQLQMQFYPLTQPPKEESPVP